MKTDSFTRNLFKYVAASLLVSALILFSILYVDEKQYAEYLGKQIFNKQLDAQVNNIKTWVELRVGYLDLASSMLEKQVARKSKGNSENQIFETLSEIKDSSTDIINAYYSDGNGKDYIDGRRQVRVEGRKQEWYRSAMVSTYYVSKPYQDALTNRLVITFSHRVVDGQGHAIGVVGFDIVFEDLMSKLKSCVESINGKIQLINGSEEAYLSPEVYSKLLPDQVGMTAGLRSEHEGKYYYIRDLGVGGYKILFEINGNQFVDNYFLKGSDYLIRLSLALIIIIFIAGYVVRRFSRPVKALTENLNELLGSGRNSLDFVNEESDLREVYSLFDQFNNHLLSNIQELEQANEALNEQKLMLESKHEVLHHTADELVAHNSALKEKEDLYSDIMENISDLIWTTDQQGVITFASKNLQALLGYEEGELVGKNVAFIVPEVGDINEGIYEMFQKRNFEGIELQLIHKTDETAIIANTRTTRIMEGDQLIGIQAVARDITYDKKLFVDYFYKNRELFVINEVNRAMTSTGSDLSRILQSITDKVNTLMNVSFCTIRILKGDELVLMAASGNAHSFIYKDSANIHNSHMGLALAKRDMINLKSLEDQLMDEPLIEKAFSEIGNLIFIPLSSDDYLFGVLNVGARKPLEEDKISMLRYLSQSASISIEKSSIYDRLRENYLKTIEALANALEEKLYNMHGHTIRVSRYATMIANHMFLKESEVDEVNIAGLLHDIGKIGINDEILKSSVARGTMDDSHMKIIACHPSIGKRIISPIGLSKRVIEGIYLHHKRYDLKGYPYEEEILEQPLIAQIIQVADDFDNLIRGTYSVAPMSIERAVEEMKLGAGSAYGPEIVDILEDLAQKEFAKLQAIEST